MLLCPYELATDEGWKPLVEVKPTNLLLGMGVRASPGAGQSMLWTRPIGYKEHHYQGVVVEYMLLRHLTIESLPTLLVLVELHPRRTINERSLQSLLTKRGIYRLLTANPRPPEHRRYELLPATVSGEELIQKKSLYLRKGLFANFAASTMSVDTLPRITSWFALSQQDFLTILSQSFDIPSDFYQRDEKLEIMEPRRTGEYLHSLQLLCAYYGLSGYLHQTARTTTLTLTPKYWRIHNSAYYLDHHPPRYKTVDEVVAIPLILTRFLLARVQGQTLLIGPPTLAGSSSTVQGGAQAV